METGTKTNITTPGNHQSRLSSRAITFAISTVTLAVGVFLGSQISVEAETPVAGSVSDPVASQSYVNSQVNQKVQAMHEKINQLEAKAAALENQVKLLEAQVK